MTPSVMIRAHAIRAGERHRLDRRAVGKRAERFAVAASAAPCVNSAIAAPSATLFAVISAPVLRDAIAAPLDSNSQTR
jgi:hypothetical protein